VRTLESCLKRAPSASICLRLSFQSSGNGACALQPPGNVHTVPAFVNKALSGDLDAVDRGDIDKKVKNAKQKLPKK